MIRYGIVVHGGAGSPSSRSDGCRRAAEAGCALLERGGSALDAVVEASVLLEDDGRYNAGRGSALRLDGRTVEMDASLMDSAGNIGAVAGVSRVRNPVLLAREVMKTPHVLLCGEGAVRFARRRGFPDFYDPSETARLRHERILRMVREGKFEGRREVWKDFDLKTNWNFEVPYEEVFSPAAPSPSEPEEATDTIGAVALDVNGGTASANSTGGASPMLLGRIGDSPLVGCGFYAGPAAAVAATGFGEEIIRKMLAVRVYDRISRGEEVQAACENGVKLYPDHVPTGVVAVCRRGAGIAANRDMAGWTLVS